MTKLIYTGLLLITLQASAQESIQAQSEGGKPYIPHTISNGETLSGLARSYKLSVAEIAAFNKIDADKVQKGQTIKIPLKTANLSQTECSKCQKVYYKVQSKEGLYRIGLNFGNVSAATLQKLNQLPGESVDIGQNLLVGFLTATGVKPSTETVKTTVEKETVKPKNDVVKTDKKTETKVAETIERKEPPLVIEKAPPIKEEPVTNTTNKANTPSVMVATQTNTNMQGNGLFEQNFAGKAGVSKSGIAAVFKSTSGWGDAKYYVLMSNAEPGTVVKVLNPLTSKTIYAKILGELPQIKQNENVLLRISNAAAAALGAGEESLNVTVSY